MTGALGSPTVGRGTERLTGDEPETAPPVQRVFLVVGETALARRVCATLATSRLDPGRGIEEGTASFGHCCPEPRSYRPPSWPHPAWLDRAWATE